MLIVLQFPIIDVRKFLFPDRKTVSKPQWSFIGSMDVNRTFVRSFGVVKYRRAGANSIGENYFVNAARAIKFDKLPSICYLNLKNQPYYQKLKIKFRRFYFDGLACAKYEIGFTLDIPLFEDSSKNINNFKIDLQQFLKELFSLEVRIPTYFHKEIRTTLLNLGNNISNHYLKSTTKNEFQSERLFGVFSGQPCVYIQRTKKEIITKTHEKYIYWNSATGSTLSFSLYEIQGIPVKIWDSSIKKRIPEVNEIAREFRIATLYLNVFRDTFAYVLKMIGTNELLPIRGSQESEYLNLFIKRCLSKYLNLDKHSALLKESDYEAIVLSFEEKIWGGEKDKLLKNLLEIIQIRGNYFKGIVEYIEKIEANRLFVTNFNTTIMGSQYNISGGQQGSVGDNATSTNNTFQQINNYNVPDNLNYENLVDELMLLKAKLKENADTAEQFEVIQNVALAEQAAKTKNGNKVVHFLKIGGEWLFKTATEIGSSIITDLIKKNIGIS